MSLHRCYSCGFETEDRAVFLSTQGTNTHHWTIFICPQCALSEPPVAEVDSDINPPWPEPKWKLSETDHGIYIVSTPSKKGGTCSGPICSEHPLLKAPASLLREGLEGSMLDHHLRLIAAGKVRSGAFHAECEVIREQTDDKDERLVLTDEARERLKVGPHSDRVEHNGPHLMRALRSSPVPDSIPE